MGSPPPGPKASRFERNSPCGTALAAKASSLAISGAAGALVGSVLLARLSGEALLAGLASLVFLYIALRLLRPDWVMSRDVGEKLSGVAGFFAGLMQGVSGISAPISITFLHAMRLERLEFMATISVFTLIPALIVFGMVQKHIVAGLTFGAVKG